MRRHGMNSSFLCGVAAFTVAFAFYAATLLPGIAFWDTGEMQTVPYLLGIAHPTGFPLFVLGGWVFSHALFLGSPAWRLSLFSALASAGAAGACAALVAELGASAWAGFCAALAFALGEVVWTRAVRAEVHDVALLFTAVAFLGAVRAGNARSPRALAATGLACGLGLATHPIVALALPGILLAAWPAVAALGPRAVLASAALGCAPLALYAYVPLRSAYVESHGLDPAVALGVAGGAFWDDGAPASPAAFARYVAGTSFDAGGSLERSLNPSGLAAARTFGATLAYREYGDVLLALALCGLVALCGRYPRLAAGFLTTAALDVSFGANFNAEAEADPARYALAAFWIVAVSAGVGASWLATGLAGRSRPPAARARPRVAAVGSCVLLLGGLAQHASSAGAGLAREERLVDARPFTTLAEKLVVPGSLVIASWTFATPLAYDAYVAGTLHARLLCAWPNQYPARYAGWRARFGHVYFVVPPRYDLAAFGRRLAATDRYQIVEWQP
jgi:hypothetical protein